jgi:hypothetical protein
VGGEALWSYFEPKIPSQRGTCVTCVTWRIGAFFGTNFSQIFLMCRWVGRRPFSVVLPPLRLTALAKAGPYPEQPSHEPHCSQFLQLKDGLRAVLLQRSPFRPWRSCVTWRLGLKQNSIPISYPQQLQRFGTRLSEFRAEIDRITLLHTPPYFRPWQDTKTTTHFANVPTATKAWTQLSKVKLYTWVPPPSTTTATILSWPYCAAQKYHSH